MSDYINSQSKASAKYTKEKTWKPQVVIQLSDTDLINAIKSDEVSFSVRVKELLRDFYNLKKD